MEESCDLSEQRIYIGNLPHDVKVAHLFSVLPEGYDKSKLEIRHNYDIDKNITSSYAFVNITGTQADLKRWCVHASKKSVGGNVLQVQFAKLSFLERLKQEVDSSKRKKNSFSGRNDTAVSDDSKYRRNNPNLIKFDDDNSFKTNIFDVPKSDEEISNPILSIDEGQKSSKAETIRLESLKERSYVRDKQQKIIQFCIKQSAKNLTNKIVFHNSDDENEDKPVELNIYDNQNDNNKKKLFEDSDGENDEDIKFSEDRPASKLIRTNISAVDERFRMDSRFFNGEPHDSQKVETSENEQDNLLKIAESMINEDPKAKIKIKNKIDADIVIPTRFNPLEKKHSSFIIKKDEDILEPEMNKKPVKLKPFKVERERYYEVSSNLKEQFKSNESAGFSLLGLFGGDTGGGKPELPSNDSSKQIEGKRQKINILKNPLDTGTSNFFNVKDNSDEEEEPVKRKVSKKSGKITWKEPLFLPLNDPRIEEALKFFSTPMEEELPHAVISRDLRNIVKKKYSRNIGKMKQFKTKLGTRRKFGSAKARKNKIKSKTKG